jgi:hypothetical protein
MATRPMNDDEVLTEMNKMVGRLIFSASDPDDDTFRAGRFHQAGDTGESS